MEFITSTEVTGSAATSIGVSGLSLSGYSRFVVFLELDNAISGSVVVAMEINGDTTATNYWQQRLFVSSTTVAGSRVNDNDVLQMLANRKLSIAMWMGVDLNDHAVGRVFGTRSNHAGNTLDTWDREFSVGSKTNITSLDFVADTASAFAVGSKIYVYGIKDS